LKECNIINVYKFLIKRNLSVFHRTNLHQILSNKRMKTLPHTQRLILPSPLRLILFFVGVFLKKVLFYWPRDLLSVVLHKVYPQKCYTFGVRRATVVLEIEWTETCDNYYSVGTVVNRNRDLVTKSVFKI